MPKPNDDAARARAQSKAEHAKAQTVAAPSNAQVLGVLHALADEVAESRLQLAQQEASLAAQDKRGRGNRRLIYGLIFSIAFDFGITGALLWFNHRISHNSSASVVNCRANVQVGKGLQDTFGPFLTDRADDPATPDIDEHEATIRFQRFIDQLAGGKCDHL